MCLNSAGQSSDVRIRERVPVKSHAQNSYKTSARPPASLKPELNQNLRGHFLNRKGTKHTLIGNQQKLREAEDFAQENCSDVQTVVLHNQYSPARTNAVVVPLQGAKRRDSVRHPAQRPSGHHGSSDVSSAERLERERRTRESGTCITGEPLPPSLEVLNDSLETHTGRKICIYILKLYALINFLTLVLFLSSNEQVSKFRDHIGRGTDSQRGLKWHMRADILKHRG